MKARNVQILFILIALGCALLFSSFGNAVETDQRALVHAIGIDLDGDIYKVTMQVFHAQGAGSDTPVDTSQSNVSIVSGHGSTVSQAMDMCGHELGKKIFLGHLQVICLGSEIDTSNPSDLFSFCLRNKNVFLGVKICMAENKAEKIISTGLKNGITSAEELSNVLEESAENGSSPQCRLIDFLSCVQTPRCIAIPILSNKTENTSSDTPEDAVAINQTAIIKDGIIKGYFDTFQAEGASWLCDKAKQSSLVIDYNDEKLSVKITDDGTHTSLTAENGVPVYNCKIALVADCDRDITNEENSNIIANQVKQKLYEQISSAWDTAIVKNSTDIFSISKMIRHTFPKEYLRLGNVGADRIACKAKLKVSINVRVE